MNRHPAMWPAEPWDHDGNDDGPVVGEPRVVGADPLDLPPVTPREHAPIPNDPPF